MAAGACGRDCSPPGGQETEKGNTERSQSLILAPSVSSSGLLSLAKPHFQLLHTS